MFFAETPFLTDHSVAACDCDTAYGTPDAGIHPSKWYERLRLGLGNETMYKTYPSSLRGPTPAHDSDGCVKDGGKIDKPKYDRDEKDRDVRASRHHR